MTRPSAANRSHQVYALPTLGGGLWLDDSPLSAPPGCAVEAHNVVINPDGSLRPRPGRWRLHEALPGKPAVVGLREVSYSGTTFLLRVYADGTVYLGSILAGNMGSTGPSVQIWTANGRVFISRNSVSDQDSVFELRGFPPQLYAVAGGVATIAVTYNPPYDLAAHQGSIRRVAYRVTGFDPDGNESASLGDVTFEDYVGSTREQVRVEFHTSTLAPYRTYNVYRKDPDSDLYLLLEQVGLDRMQPEGPGRQRFSVNGDPFRPLQARTAPDNVFMSGRGLSCISANRLWTVHGGMLYYSNPFDITTRSELAVERITLSDGLAPTAIVPFNQGVVIFSRHAAAYVTGPPLFGGQFLPLNLSVGCVSPNAWTYVDG